MLHLICRPLVCVCMLAAISSSLYAVDGVVLINQNSALAGNVTPDDAPGFPVTLSQSGSYRLSGNLTVPDVNTTAIQITADFVTVDLNGFSIIGPNICTPNPTICSAQGSGTGVLVANGPGNRPQGARVLNGTVRGMGLNGIFLAGRLNAVERVNAHGNGDLGISLATGSVIDSSASVNKSIGIRAEIISGSTAVQNGGSGIFVFNLATGNLAVLNGENGMSIFGNATVTGNTSLSNKGSGILAACPSNIFGNTTSGNQGDAITTSGIGCKLTNNAP